MSNLPIRNLVLDFDDTLVVAALTWTIDVGLPRFIQTHGLTASPEKLDAALLHAQEASRSGDDPMAVLTRFFEQMEWDHTLQMQLFNDVTEQYQPSLFADTLPFLQAVKHRVERVIVLSNNNRAPAIAESLGIAPLLPVIITPKRAPGTLPKPDASLWHFARGQFPDITTENTVFIGDDPWSDGAFAVACGLRFYLVDRKRRYRHLPHDVFRFIDQLTADVLVSSD